MSDRSYPVLVLLSGGLDSSCLVHYHLLQGDKVTAIYFDYGQQNSEREFQSAKAISKYYDIQLSRETLGFKINNYEGEFYCRNALFVLAACSFLGESTSLISLGIHSGTPYYDSTSAFVTDTQTLLNGYFGGVIRVTTPFLDYTKVQIFDYALQEKMPVQLTYSCEIGEQEPCNLCRSCIDRRMLNEKSPGKD
ncbi:7-cyano-7-deazaguanine synthase [Paenibacillus agricola]|uniref:7-cyano-7-deazaguanine synthase n=1 Tax=Paenibacillus agricola TaxID=2716264 RepID=A0ABX0JHA1_9BACL|nr:7-cyano-7-deazaguanine synthase [Paenibacillus agricola]NHN35333.1 ATPase [Paenibacillus agricola]